MNVNDWGDGSIVLVDAHEKIVVRAKPWAYIILVFPPFIIVFICIFSGMFGELREDNIFPCFLWIYIAALNLICLKGWKLEINGGVFVYRDWLYREKRMDLKKISSVREGYFITKRMIIRDKELHGVRIKYDGKFIVINVRYLAGKDCKLIINTLKDVSKKLST